MLQGPRRERSLVPALLVLQVVTEEITARSKRAGEAGRWITVHDCDRGRPGERLFPQRSRAQRRWPPVLLSAGRLCHPRLRRSTPSVAAKPRLTGSVSTMPSIVNGSPVILLHGGLANADYWGNQIKALAPYHTVIVMDSRGHGRSTRDSRPYGYDLMADDVVALMDVLKVPKADIVGWSDATPAGSARFSPLPPIR